MDVERIQRVPDFVRNASREQSQRIETFRFDRLLRRATAFGDVAQNHGVTDRLRPRRLIFSSASARRSIVKRHNVKIDEPVRRIKNLHVATERAGRFRKRVPIQTADAIGQPLADGCFRIQTENFARGIVHIRDAPAGIGDDDSFLNGIENRSRENLSPAPGEADSSAPPPGRCGRAVRSVSQENRISFCASL